jgi:hypothetical protein
MKYIFLVLLLTSCRTTASKSEGTSELTNTNSGPSVPSDEASGEVFANVLTFIGIESLKQDSGSDKMELKFSAKSEVEYFCERRCSKHSLKDTASGEMLQVGAFKMPVVGNTSPSRLSEDKKSVSVDLSKTKRIFINNVGKMGNTVEIDLAKDQMFSNFYATFAELKTSMAIGGESSGYSITFDGKSMDASFDDAGLAAQVSASGGGGIKGLVTGVMITKEGVERGVYKEFLVKTLDTTIQE